MIIDWRHPAFRFLRCWDENGDLMQVTSIDLAARFGFNNGCSMPVSSYCFEGKSSADRELIASSIPEHLLVASAPHQEESDEDAAVWISF